MPASVHELNESLLHLLAAANRKIIPLKNHETELFNVGAVYIEKIAGADTYTLSQIKNPSGTSARLLPPMRSGELNAYLAAMLNGVAFVVQSNPKPRVKKPTPKTVVKPKLKKAAPKKAVRKRRVKKTASKCRKTSATRTSSQKITFK